MAFDEIDIGGFLAVECGVPGPVEGAGGALEDIGEAAEVGLAFFGVLGAEAEDEGAVVAPLVVFEEVEAGLAGLDVEAVLDGDAAGGVVVEGEVPLAGEEVGVGVAVAEAGFAPLDAGELDAHLEDEEVEHGGAVLASAPEDDGIAKLSQPVLGAVEGLIDEGLQVWVHQMASAVMPRTMPPAAMPEPIMAFWDAPAVAPACIWAPWRAALLFAQEL